MFQSRSGTWLAFVLAGETNVTKKAMGWLWVSVAAGVAMAAIVPLRRRRLARQAEGERLDEASEESFPASDPPSHSSPAASAGRP